MRPIIFSLLFSIIILLSTNASADNLLIQVKLKNYEGEKAYSVLYLVSPNGRYEQTLWVAGDEAEWQEEGLPRWWKYQSRKPQDFDAITGASLGSGDRFKVSSSLDSDLIDQGYKLRVETSVEDLPNYTVDAEVELTTENIGKKIKGAGWVRYIRFKW